MKAAKLEEIGWIILPKNASQKHNRRAYKIGSDHLYVMIYSKSVLKLCINIVELLFKSYEEILPLYE